MSSEATTIVQRLWNYCNVLRDDGVSYGDYVEQLTYLLFLKMADEQTKLFKTTDFLGVWQELKIQTRTRTVVGDDVEGDLLD